MSNLYLIGMMGCGKSTLAKVLASRTGKKHIDLDKEIENEEGCSISEIFADKGEKYFREAETRALKKVAEQSGGIIACGGGIVLNPENTKLMRESGCVVYLFRNTENILKDIDTSKRPLLNSDAQNLNSIYEKRKSLYEEAAHNIIDNNGDLEKTAEEIAECCKDIFNAE